MEKPEFNKGECGKTCNCIEISEWENGGNPVKNSACLGQDPELLKSMVAPFQRNSLCVECKQGLEACTCKLFQKSQVLSMLIWKPGKTPPEEDSSYIVIIEHNGKLDMTDDEFHNGNWVNFEPIWWAKKAYPITEKSLGL